MSRRIMPRLAGPSRLWDRDARLDTVRRLHAISPLALNAREAAFLRESVARRRLRATVATVLAAGVGAALAVLAYLRGAAATEAQSTLARERFAAAQQEAESGGDLGRALLLLAAAVEASPGRDPRRGVYALRAAHLAAGAPDRVLHLGVPVTYYTFDAQWRHVAATVPDAWLGVWDTRTGRPLPTPFDTAKGRWLAQGGEAFSQDGRLAASFAYGGEEGREPEDLLYVWETETGATRMVKLHEWQPEILAFSADGSRLLLAEWDLASDSTSHLRLRVWDVEGGRVVADIDSMLSMVPARVGTYLQGRPSPGATGFADPTGARSVGVLAVPGRFWVLLTRAASNGRGYESRLLDLATGRVLSRRPLVHPDPVLDVAFGPDSSTVAVLTANVVPRSDTAAATARHRRLRTWNPLTGAPLTPPVATAHEHIAEVRRDGSVVTRGDSGFAVHRWGNGPDSAVTVLRDRAQNGFALLEGGRYLAVDGSRVARVWAMGTDALLHRGERMVAPGRHAAGSFVFGPDGRIALPTRDGVVMFWHPLPLDEQSSPRVALPDRLATGAFSPDGSRVAATILVGDSVLLSVADTRTGAPLWARPLRVPGRAVQELRWSVDGGGIAFAVLQGDSAALYLLEGTGEVRCRIPVQGGIRTAAYGPDRKTATLLWQLEMVTVRAQRWDAERCVPLWRDSRLHGAMVVAMSAGGDAYLLEDFSSRVLQQWSAADTQQARMHAEEGSGIDRNVATALLRAATAVHRDSDTSVVVTLPAASFRMIGSTEGITVRATRRGNAVVAPRPAFRESRVAVVSPDGRWLALLRGGGDATEVIVLDAATGTPLVDGIPHLREVVAISFDSAGERLLTLDDEGVVRAWPVAPPAAGSAAWAARLGEGLMGVRLDGEGVMKRIPDYPAVRSGFRAELNAAAAGGDGLAGVVVGRWRGP
jgi:hypothetical protein